MLYNRQLVVVTYEQIYVVRAAHRSGKIVMKQDYYMGSASVVRFQPGRVRTACLPVSLSSWLVALDGSTFAKFHNRMADPDPVVEFLDVKHFERITYSAVRGVWKYDDDEYMIVHSKNGVKRTKTLFTANYDYTSSYDRYWQWTETNIHVVGLSSEQLFIDVYEATDSAALSSHCALHNMSLLPDT